MIEVIEVRQGLEMVSSAAPNLDVLFFADWGVCWQVFHLIPTWDSTGFRGTDLAMGTDLQAAWSSERFVAIEKLYLSTHFSELSSSSCSGHLWVSFTFHLHSSSNIFKLFHLLHFVGFEQDYRNTEWYRHHFDFQNLGIWPLRTAATSSVLWVMYS